MTKKKLYITTAIPYANGAPHIGNALDYLIADIWARYQRQQGNEVRFQVGTDEHGNKIAEKAAENGLTPQEYVDGTVQNFKNLMDKMKTTYTDFVRTTDSHHVGASQYIWMKLQPYIYKNSYEGWYCTGCESFYTEKKSQNFTVFVQIIKNLSKDFRKRIIICEFRNLHQKSLKRSNPAR